MASSSSLTTDTGNTPEAINYLMDEKNNLSVIFASPLKNETKGDALKNGSTLSQVIKEEPKSEQLRDWIKNCNNCISTVNNQNFNNDELTNARSELLASFPKSLHFPIGALFDFANRLGNSENPQLTDKVGLETQTIMSSILCLQQRLKQKPARPGQHPVCSDNEREATWHSYKNLIEHCSRSQRWNITLDSASTTYLPTLSQDMRLIIQNVIFSVLKGSGSSTPIDIHAANISTRNGERNCFSLAVKVVGNPLANVLGATYFSGYKKTNTFIFEGSGIGHIIAAKLIEFLSGDIIITNNCDGTNTITLLIPLEHRSSKAG